jgi:hypothetical protein
MDREGQRERESGMPVDGTSLVVARRDVRFRINKIYYSTKPH